MSRNIGLSGKRVVYALALLVLLAPASAWDENGQAGVPPGRDAASSLAAASQVEAVEALPSLSEAEPPAPRAAAVEPATPKPDPAAAVVAPPSSSAPSTDVSQPPAGAVQVEPGCRCGISSRRALRATWSISATGPASKRQSAWTGIQRGRFVVQQLQSVAQSSQKNVRAYLDSKGVSYRSFWIDNVILVEESDLTVFNELKRFPEISIIRDRRTEKLIEPASKAPVSIQQLFSIEPNITHVQAPEAWALGINGLGSVVSSIDTGVRYTHQALVGKYRGNLGGGAFNHNYNWWDPYGDHPTAPADDNGHGSHTMGTMVGDDGGSNQIGMAPGAKWLACRGCNTNNCTDAALLECAQFIAAPWDLSQANPNPDLRPDVGQQLLGRLRPELRPLVPGRGR